MNARHVTRRRGGSESSADKMKRARDGAVGVERTEDDFDDGGGGGGGEGGSQSFCRGLEDDHSLCDNDRIFPCDSSSLLGTGSEVKYGNVESTECIGQSPPPSPSSPSDNVNTTKIMIDSEDFSSNRIRERSSCEQNSEVKSNHHHHYSSRPSSSPYHDSLSWSEEIGRMKCKSKSWLVSSSSPLLLFQSTSSSSSRSSSSSPKTLYTKSSFLSSSSSSSPFRFISSVNVVVKVMFWVLVFNYHLSVLEACPLVCTCKWKSGKQTVECKYQALETLPDSIDPETQVLDISGNKLGFLPQDAFRRAGLLNLQRIHIRNSRLTQIDPGAFNELKNLVEIDLGDNLLTSIPSHALKATPFLRDLNLAGNPIQRIPKGGFEFVPQLVKLDLSRCQLIEIDSQAFAHLKLLESLKLGSNRLTTLSNLTVKSLAQLHAIELHDNPWDCDCRLRDLKLWIENKNIPHPVSPPCHSPPRLARKRFNELSVSEFACPPRILEPTPQTPRQVRATEGENVNFECLIESIPAPVVRWYWFNRLIENNTLRKYVIYERENGSVLTLTNAMKKDEGEVYCFVENAAGSAEANFTLEILPQPTLQNFLDTTQILVIILAIVAILLVSLAVGIFLFLRLRRSRSAKPPEILATSTPVKPPRLNYEINPGSLVANGFKQKGDSATDNPDLILETNTNGTYQETAVEDQSSNSELNWEQQSYRNMGYASEYPPDYGLPIIHENSVYSDSSYYNVNVSAPGLNGSAVMSGVWNKNKVGARITAPNSRDSPDEGYQEGYCGTDV